MKFHSDTGGRIVTALLLLQATAYYAVAFRSEVTPAIAPLSSFPTVLDGWVMQKDWPLEKETADVLRADDTVNRLYTGPGGVAVNFFVAFFKTQRYGQAPHSPKNCLPGSGWEQMEAGTIAFPVPGRSAPIVTNKYVVQRGTERSVVLYWYQSRDRVVASEYTAKFWLVADAIRYRRSDTSIVKIVVPVAGENTAGAIQTATRFAQSAFPALARQLPQ